MPPPPTADTVLDLEARKRIVAFVRANPGLHLRELAARLGMAVSTLEYHCYQLAKHGHVVTRESAGFKAFYPGEGLDRRDKDILYLVRHEAPRRVCSHVLLNPGCTPKQLRQALGVSAPTLSFHLNKLRSAGVLREEPAGRTKNLFVTDPERVANVLVTYRQSFLDDAVDRFAAAWLALAPPQLPRRKGAGEEAAEEAGDEAAKEAGESPAGPPWEQDAPHSQEPSAAPTPALADDERTP